MRATPKEIIKNSGAKAAIEVHRKTSGAEEQSGGDGVLQSSIESIEMSKKIARICLCASGAASNKSLWQLGEIDNLEDNKSLAEDRQNEKNFIKLSGNCNLRINSRVSRSV